MRHRPRRISMLLCVLCVFAATPLSAEDAPPKHTNRLAKEKSPYLLQHAHNPVDWYPWGDEAFAAAKKQNKPIFLSIGYSTCHWCHVMERECFEDEAIAKLMNETCVAIKVDREERPDVDRVYMAYVQGTTGAGGWPLNVLLTSDLKPFYGGTYFPPDDTDGSPGLKKVMRKTAEAWANDRAAVEGAAGNMAEAMKRLAKTDPPAAGAAAVGPATIAQAVERLKRSFDKIDGGFDAAPKFPQPTTLNFLLRHHARTGDAAAKDMALQTLRAMAAGGIHDVLGGGFHRYSTDGRWFLPHFEKMLYDQAQIAAAYLDAYQLTHDETFALTARDTLDYVLRDLTGTDGQFFSAEDADSLPPGAGPAAEKREGAFYVWTKADIDAALGAEDAALFNAAHGVKQGGNVDRDPRKEFSNQNVLSRATAAEALAKQFGKPGDELEARLAAARAKLFDARAKRPRPHLDDKTLTAWNALMISTCARAGRILKDDRYLVAADRAADFLVANLYDAPARTLYRRHRDGQRDVAGFADDYAFFIAALLDLYEATADVRRLQLALTLQARMDELFLDPAGGYFSTAAGAASLLVRMKDDADNVEPAASSVAAMNLLRLAQMTGDKALRASAASCMSGFADRLGKFPQTMPQMLVAVGFSQAKPRQIVLAGDPKSPALIAMLNEVYAAGRPDRVILFADGGAGQQFLGQRLEFLKSVAPVGGKATAFVCENYACQLPTADLATLRELLGK